MTRALDRAQRGAAAEDLAAGFVAAQGAQLVVRNYRCRLGELDLVALLGRVLIVAEVRTRSSERYGGAAASIDARKRRRIVRATQRLLIERKELARLPVRFDVIVVSGIGSAVPRIEWLKHAFEA
jgi:putative endonuclease